MRVVKQPMETELAGWGGTIRTSASENCVPPASRRGQIVHALAGSPAHDLLPLSRCRIG
jgi:hypothetical protein